MYVGAYPPGCIRDSSSYQRIAKNPSLCRKDDTHFCLENPRSNTWNSKNRTIVFWCAVQKWCAQWRETRFSFCGLTHIFCTHLDHECIWLSKLTSWMNLIWFYNICHLYWTILTNLNYHDTMIIDYFRKLNLDKRISVKTSYVWNLEASF